MDVGKIIDASKKAVQAYVDLVNKTYETNISYETLNDTSGNRKKNPLPPLDYLDSTQDHNVIIPPQDNPPQVNPLQDNPQQNNNVIIPETHVIQPQVKNVIIPETQDNPPRVWYYSTDNNTPQEVSSKGMIDQLTR